MPITLRGVTKEYRRKGMVLKGVDLEVAEGERVAIVGPSGSGKTTLLSILGLLVEPTAGDVLLDGVAPLRKHGKGPRAPNGTFGWVLQTTNVLERRTAVDNTAIPLLASGVSRREAHRLAVDALAVVGLGSRASTPVRHLSGGEVQRVCVARALAHKPKVLLADEPTGQLDEATSLGVMDALHSLLSDTGATLVVATHDRAVVAGCDRVADVIDGRVQVR